MQFSGPCAAAQADYSPSHGIELGGEANNYLLASYTSGQNLVTGAATEGGGHKRSNSSDIQLLFGGSNRDNLEGLHSGKQAQLLQPYGQLSASASSPSLIAEPSGITDAAVHDNAMMNSNNNFFSLTEDDEDINIRYV